MVTQVPAQINIPSTARYVVTWVYRIQVSCSLVPRSSGLGMGLGFQLQLWDMYLVNIRVNHPLPKWRVTSISKHCEESTLPYLTVLGQTDLFCKCCSSVPWYIPYMFYRLFICFVYFLFVFDISWCWDEWDMVHFVSVGKRSTTPPHTFTRLCSREEWIQTSPSVH